MKVLFLRSLLFAACAVAGTGAVLAQDTPPQPQADDEPVRVGEGVVTVQPIAVPYMPTPAAADTAAGNTEALGRQIAQIVATDLGNSGLFNPIGPSGLPAVSFPQVQAPDFGAFSATGAQNLVQGFVQANGNGNQGCYLAGISDALGHLLLALLDVEAQPSFAVASSCTSAARTPA